RRRPPRHARVQGHDPPDVDRGAARGAVRVARDGDAARPGRGRPAVAGGTARAARPDPSTARGPRGGRAARPGPATRPPAPVAVRPPRARAAPPPPAAARRGRLPLRALRHDDAGAGAARALDTGGEMVHYAVSGPFSVGCQSFTGSGRGGARHLRQRSGCVGGHAYPAAGPGGVLGPAAGALGRRERLGLEGGSEELRPGDARPPARRRQGARARLPALERDRGVVGSVPGGGQARLDRRRRRPDRHHHSAWLRQRRREHAPDAGGGDDVRIAARGQRPQGAPAAGIRRRADRAPPRGARERPGRLRRQVLGYAVRFAGAPYVWGGTSDRPQTLFGHAAAGGFDCSGFVWWVLKLHRYRLASGNAWSAAIAGRTIYAMARALPVRRRIPYSKLRPGDVLFSSDKAPHGVSTHWEHIFHTGIYLGNGWAIDSHGAGDGVTIDQMSPGSGWFHDF